MSAHHLFSLSSDLYAQHIKHLRRSNHVPLVGFSTIFNFNFVIVYAFMTVVLTLKIKITNTSGYICNVLDIKFDDTRRVHFNIKRKITQSRFF